MPTWKALTVEITQGTQQARQIYDTVRRKYLHLHRVTKRNIIIYYSGWLQKPELFRQGLAAFVLNDADKNGFMATIHKLDRALGLDLVIHTPGGEMAATESIVDYLRSMFGTNIRAFVPQIALSGGTMIALSCKEIYMGKHSSLGPIDPQISGIPAHGVIEEFERAKQEIREDKSTIPVWQPVIAKYPPAFIGECEKAIDWANEMVEQWLISGMFAGYSDAPKKANKIIKDFGDHALTKSHSRHISMERAKNDAGVEIKALEDDQKLQDAVLTVHHACILTLQGTTACKLIENHTGMAYIQHIQSAAIKKQ